MSKNEKKTKVAWRKGEAVKLTTTDYVGALTRGDPDWSARPPPPKPKPKPEMDLDRLNWLKKRKEQG